MSIPIGFLISSKVGLIPNSLKAFAKASTGAIEPKSTVVPAQSNITAFILPFVPPKKVSLYIDLWIKYIAFCSHIICLGTKIISLHFIFLGVFYSHIICLGTKITAVGTVKPIGFTVT